MIEVAIRRERGLIRCGMDDNLVLSVIMDALQGGGMAERGV